MVTMAMTTMTRTKANCRAGLVCASPVNFHSTNPGNGTEENHLKLREFVTANANGPGSGAVITATISGGSDTALDAIT